MATVAISGLSLPLAVAAIAVSLDTLGGSVVVAGGTTIAVAIARLSSGEAGERKDDLEKVNLRVALTKMWGCSPQEI